MISSRWSTQGWPQRLAQRFGAVVPGLLKFARRNYGAFSVGLGVCGLSLALYASVYLVPHPSPWLRFLENLELRTLDVRFQLRGPIRPDPSVVIVAIDQKSQDILGRWPFPRSNLAEAVDFLREAKARVIAFDIDFPQPDQNSALQALRELQKKYSASTKDGRKSDPFEAVLNSLAAQADNDQKLAEALSRFDNAILGYFFYFSEKETKNQNQQTVNAFRDYLLFQAYPQVSHPEYGKFFDCQHCVAIGVSPDLPQFVRYAKSCGFFNVLGDADGTVRREPVTIRLGQSYYPSLDIATVLAYTDRPLDQVSVFFNPNGLERIDLGSVSVPTSPDGYVQIDFHGPSGTYPTYSLADVVQRKVPAALFRDRIVLIGATATGIADTQVTPFQTMAFPGVEVHANFVDNLLNSDFIRRGLRENLWDLAVIVFFSLPVGILLSLIPPARAAGVLLFLEAVFLWTAYRLFAFDRIWLAVFLPSATLFVTYGGVVSYKYVFEEREKMRVKKAFQQYMAPEVIRQLLDRPALLRLGGKEEDITVMFCDIRGFTSISEKLPAPGLVRFLNEYFSEMTEIIFRQRGTLDKYIGDAIMAFWGAPFPQPNPPELACGAALEMLRALRRLDARWESQGMPPVDIGIGINTGPMLVGNMGSLRRFNYTIMGDNVNLASRLEGLNKSFGTRLIISESTYECVWEKFMTRELDLIRVEGKKKPVRIYEVLGPIEETGSLRGLVDRFHAALGAYRNASWEEAAGLFGELLRDFPEDGPTRLFIDRCWSLLQETPEAWDGVYVMKAK